MNRVPGQRRKSLRVQWVVASAIALGAFVAWGVLSSSPDVESTGNGFSPSAESSGHIHLGGFQAGDPFPEFPSDLVAPGTDVTAQELRAPFSSGENWQVYSDENYPAELYGEVRSHYRWGSGRVPFDLGDPTIRSQEVLAMGSGYATVTCLTENMAIVLLEIQGHGRFIHAHMDRSELPEWMSEGEWTAVAQGQSLGRLWDNLYRNYVRQVGDDGCVQVTFGEHLHLEIPVGTVIDGLTVSTAAPNIEDVLTSTNTLRNRPTCNGEFATLIGSTEDDVLVGTSQRDVIIGLGGNDTVQGASAQDLVCIGTAPGPVAQDDEAFVVVAPQSVLVDVLANDSVGASAATVEVTSQPAQATATVEGDQIRYTPGVSTSTTDSFTYEACVDGLCSEATVLVEITPPICRRTSALSFQATIWGTNGPDTIRTGAGDDVIVAFGGDDVINAGDGSNTVCAGAGNDSVTAGDGVDYIFGFSGNDTIRAGLGVDRVFGQDGDDDISGGGGSDILRAGPGDDLVNAGSGADHVWGGSGSDILNGQGGQDTMYGEGGNDVMQGNWQSDRLYGGSGNDIIRGAGGRDRLYGQDGNDTLYGGLNTDYLEGGAGTDTADGQSGRDNPFVRNVSGCEAETEISC